LSTATVAVIDDDEAVRDSLQALLEANGYVVSAYGTAESFLGSYREGQAGCALVDLQMPGMDGLALLSKLQEMKAMVPVVMVTGHGDVPLAVKAIKAGAVDFIEKPYPNQLILETVRRALQAVMHVRADEKGAAEFAARIQGLTPREREVLDQLVIGHANKIIAYELKISPRTVEIHRANLMKKMQADSLSHLVRMVLAARGQSPG
jgi:two-component system, LuxR family, response regulator FixJ